MSKMLNMQLSSAGGTTAAINAIWSNNIASTGVPGQDPANPPFNATRSQFIPLDTNLGLVTVRATAPPGVTARSQSSRIKKNSNTQLGGDIVYTDPAFDATVNIAATLPGVGTGSNAAIDATKQYRSSWPSASNASATEYWAYSYEVASFPNVSWYVMSIADIATSTFAATDTYAHVQGQQFSNAFTPLSGFQAPWPIAGTIQYCSVVWANLSAGTSVEIALQKGSTLGSAADTAILFACSATSPTSNFQSILDTTTQVAVIAGEMLNWRIKRTAGTGTTGSFCVAFGFTAN